MRNIRCVRTISVDPLNAPKVYEWCFKHLQEPAYLLSFKHDGNSITADMPIIWRVKTSELVTSPLGSYRWNPQEVAMTLLFESKEDAILFSLRWGIIPITENSFVLKYAPHLINKDFFRDFHSDHAGTGFHQEHEL